MNAIGKCSACKRTVAMDVPPVPGIYSVACAQRCPHCRVVTMIAMGPEPAIGAGVRIGGRP